MAVIEGIGPPPGTDTDHVERRRQIFKQAIDVGMPKEAALKKVSEYNQSIGTKLPAQKPAAPPVQPQLTQNQPQLTDPHALNRRSIYSGTIDDGGTKEQALSRIHEYNYAVKQGINPSRAQEFAYSLDTKPVPKALSQGEKAQMYENITAMSEEERTKRFIFGDPQKWVEGYAEARSKGMSDEDSIKYASGNTAQRGVMRGQEWAAPKWRSFKSAILGAFGSLRPEEQAENPWFRTEEEKRAGEFRKYSEASWLDKKSRIAGSIDVHLGHLLEGFTSPDMAAIEVASLGTGALAKGGLAFLGEAAEETSTAQKILNRGLRATGRAAGRGLAAQGEGEAGIKAAESVERAMQAVRDARVPVSVQATVRNIQKLAHAGFAVQMAEGTLQSGGAAVKKFKEGDVGEGIGYSLEALVNGAMVAGSVTHMVAEHGLHEDLNKKTEEVYQDKKFGQLTDQQQAVVINKLIEDDAKYKLAADASEKQMRQAARKINARYNDAVQQAWNPNAVSRGIRMIHEERAETARTGAIKDLVATIRQQVEKRTAELKAERDQTEKQISDKKEASANLRETTRQYDSVQRNYEAGGRKALAADRKATAERRAEVESTRAEDTTGPQRDIPASVDENGHVSYPAEFWGQTNTFGVGTDEERHSVYRNTPQGREWLDRSGNFTDQPESLYWHADPKAADTTARLSAALYAADNLAGQDDATEEQQADASKLRETFTALVNGEITAKEAQSQAGIQDKVDIPDEHRAAVEGRLNGPYHEKSPAEYAGEFEAGMRDSGMAEEEIQATLDSLPDIAWAQIESNLNHVSRSGDYIVSKRGVTWTLDGKGMLHPSDGGAPVPLLKRGTYSNTAMQLAGSGRVGYGAETMERRKLRLEWEEAGRKALERMDASADGPHGFGEEPEDEKVARRRAYEAKQKGRGLPPPPGSKLEGEQAAPPPRTLAHPALLATIPFTDDARYLRFPDMTLDAFLREAERAGIPPEDLVRLKIMQSGEPTRKAVAGLTPGDRVEDAFRKDAPWVVEPGKGGSLWLRSGQARLELDRVNPSERVMQLVRRGTITSDSITLPKGTYESPVKAMRDEAIAAVQERAKGPTENPPKNQVEAKAQAQTAERRADIVTDAAVESAVKAVNPEITATDADISAAVDESEVLKQVAKGAAAQAAQAKGRAAGPGQYPQKASISARGYSEGLVGKSGYVQTNAGKVQVHLELVRMEELTPSFRWNGNQLERVSEYPEAMQDVPPDESTRSQLLADAQPVQYDVDQYLDPGNGPERGPSIIDDGGYVAGGNRRLLRMMKHLELIRNDPAALEVFRMKMQLFGEKNGMTYPETDDILIPVRMMDEPIGTIARATELGDLFNKSASFRIDQSAKSITHGRLLHEAQLEEEGKGQVGVLDRIANEFATAETPREAMENRPQFFADTVRKYLKVSGQESQEWFNKNTAGEEVLSVEGKEKLERALLATVLKNPSTLESIRKSTAYQALLKAIGPMTRLRTIEGKDITDLVEEAVHATAATERKRAEGDSPRARWNKAFTVTEMFADEAPMEEPNRIVEALWRAMHDRKTTRFKNTLNDYLVGEGTQQNIFAEEANLKTSSELFNEAFQSELEEVKDSRGLSSEGAQGIKGGEGMQDYLKTLPWEVSQEEFDAAMNHKPIAEVVGDKSSTDIGGRGEKTPEQPKGEETPPAVQQEAKVSEKTLWPPPKPKTPQVAALKGMTPLGAKELEAPPTAKTADAKIAEEKATQGYVTPDQLKDFLQNHPATKEHAHELYRTADLMAQYVWEADHPEGVEKKNALSWVLYDRLARIEAGGMKTKRGEYSDPALERDLGTRIMKLHEASDPSTFIHEFAHVVFPLLSDEDLKLIDTIGGKAVWDGKGPSLKGDVYRSLSEKFAHGMEQFLRDANPTGFTAEVKAVLGKVKDMMRKVYLAFKKDPLAEYRNTVDSRQVFADMFQISDFDVSDDWKKEVEKARKKEKELPKPSDAVDMGIAAKMAREMGGIGAAKAMEGKVEDTVGDRVDPAKPSTTIVYHTQEEAVSAALKMIGEDRAKGADIIKGTQGKWGVKVNITKDVLNQESPELYQDAPERHPGLKLEDLEERLRKTPTFKLMERKLLQTQIENLKNRIRADHGVEERKPVSVPDVAKKAVQEAKNADAVRAVPNGTTGLPKPPTASGLPKPPKLGMSDNAGTGGQRGGAGGKPVARVPTSLADVKPVNLQPLPKERGAAVGTVKGEAFDQKAWTEGLKRAGLPENTPAPTVSIERTTAAQLRYPGQKQVVQTALSALQQGDGVVIATPTGTGKCLGKGTPVLMADGTILPVEEVRVGDQVMGPDSKPRNVMGVAHGFDEMYRVTPTKGDSYTVNRPHVLSLKYTNDGTRWARAGIVNIPVSEYVGKSKYFKHKTKGYRVGVKFSGQSIPMDPYIFGVWLGDGTSSRPSVTSGDLAVVVAWNQYVESLGGWIREDNIRESTKEYTAVFCKRYGGGRIGKNKVREVLLRLGVIENKHIPYVYKVNDEETRLALLAGLIDTDGSLSCGGYDFISKWEVLARDVVFVARSLGFAAYVRPCWKACSNGNGGIYYRVFISGDVARIPVRIGYKKASPRQQKKDVLVTGIKVDSIGIGEYFGFEVDGDHLFLLGDFTVTHNSYTASAIIKEFQKPSPNSKILYITKNAKLKKKTAGVAKNTFGFEMDVDKPKDTAQTGVWAVSYMGMMSDNIYKQMKWDLVVADESGEARNWFKPENKQGKLLMDVMANAKKGVYTSATPFHSPSEYGYLEKLGLWRKGEFDKFIQENFAHENVDGKIVAKLDPGKQAKLRQQLIERGQLISQAISYEGFTAHFGVVPVTDSMKRGLDRIREGFTRAKSELLKAGKKGLAEKSAAFEATYTKAFLERERIPQAIEIAKKARAQGYQVVIFSEHSAEDLFRRPRSADEDPSTYQELDDAMGGMLSNIIPPFPNVYDQLRAEFGTEIGDYSGRGNTLAEREKAINGFLKGEMPMLYSTYAAGGIGVDMHDADFPELGVKGGDKPRLFLFLGPPYSGVLLEQALGRGWRFAVLSDVHAVFLATDSEPDIRLMQQKVGPRMRALRAAVLGERDSLASAMASYTDEEKIRARQDALAYTEGDEQKVNATAFQVRSKSRNVGIDDWSTINFPHADTAKNKGMKYGEEVPGNDWSRLYQDKEDLWKQGPPTPEKAAAEKAIDEVAQSASMNPDIPRETIGMAAARAVEVSDVAPEGMDKAAAGRMTMEGTLNSEGYFQDPLTGGWTIPHGLVKEMMGDDVSAIDERELKHYTRPTLGMNFEQRAISAGRKIGAEREVRDVLNRVRGYFQKSEGVKGDLQAELADIHKMTGIDMHDENVMREVWDVKEGRRSSGNPKVNETAGLLAYLTDHAREVLEKGSVSFVRDDGSRGTYADIKVNPTYMPRITDWNMKLTDPVSGETKTLKEITDDRTLSDSAKLRYLEAKRIELGESEQSASQWLEDLKRERTQRLRGPKNANVTMRRKMNHPFYRKDMLALMSYIDQVASAVALEENFGSDMGKLRQDIARIPNNMLRTDILSGVATVFEHPDWTTSMGQVVRHGQGLEALTKMTLSPISAMFHGIHATLGLGGRVKPLVKSGFRFMTNPHEMMREKYYLGVVSSRLNPFLVEGGKKGLANRFFEFSGFNSIYRMTRAIVGDSARVWMEQDSMGDLKKGGKRGEEARRILKDTMLIGDRAIDQAVANGHWDEDSIAKGQRAFTDYVAFTENPLQMPKMARLSMGDGLTNAEKNLHAAARGAYMLQSFSIKTYSLLKEKLFDEVFVHGNLKPLIPFLLLYPAAGTALQGLKAGVKGGTQRAIEKATGKAHSQDAWDKFFEQFKDVEKHPWSAPLKIYLDGICTAAALERVKRWGDMAMMFGMGEKKKASNMFGYMVEDELEQDVGGLFSDIYNFFASQAHAGKDTMQTKKEEKKSQVFWRDEAREFEQVIPFSRSIPGVEGMAHPPKQNSGSRRYF